MSTRGVGRPGGGVGYELFLWTVGVRVVAIFNRWFVARKASSLVDELVHPTRERERVL